MDISRLQIQLLRTKLQNKDNTLYQLLNQMITGLRDVTNSVSSIDSSGTSSNTITNNTINNTILGSIGIGQSVGGITGIIPPIYSNPMFTAGSVIFAGPSGQLRQNNAKLFWDNTSFRLGIGTATPETDLAVHGFTYLGFVDNPSDNVVEIRSLAGGFAFKNAAASLQYGAFIGGGTSALSSLTGGLRLASTTGDGIIIQENGGNTFFGGPIKLNGNTSSFPMLSRSTVEIRCKLADDSAFTTFRAEKLYANQGGGGASAGEVFIAPLAVAAQFGGIWFGQASPSSSNYAFLGSSSGVGTTLFNAVTGGDVEMRINNNARLNIGALGISVNETSAVLPTIPLTIKDQAKANTLLTLTDAGKLSVLNNVLNLKSYTVATLPTGVVGDMAYVTDATGPTFLTALVGGGAVKSPAFHNGTTWVAF